MLLPLLKHSQEIEENSPNVLPWQNSLHHTDSPRPVSGYSTPTTMIRATGNLDGRGAAGPPVLSSGTLARLLPLRESLVAVSIPSPV